MYADPIEVFDDATREAGLHFDGHLNQLVEMIGRHFKHSQYPGEDPAINMIISPGNYKPTQPNTAQHSQE